MDNVSCIVCERAARTLGGRTIRHDRVAGAWFQWERRQHRWEPLTIDADQTARIAVQFFGARRSTPLSPGETFSEALQRAALLESQRDTQFLVASHNDSAGMLHVHNVGHPKPRTRLRPGESGLEGQPENTAPASDSNSHQPPPSW